MNNPWGISGPEFIWLYIGAFGLALIALFILRRVGRSGSTGHAGHEPLTVEETAYLSGGWLRMVESAIAGLVSRNVIRIERNGYIYAVSNPAQGPESGLEEAVVHAVDGRAGRTVGQIQSTLAGDPMFDRLHKSLEDRGLTYGGGRPWLSVTPLIVLFAVGAARWVNGVNLGFPVVYLGILLIITLVVIIFTVQPVKPGVTKTGREVLAQRASSVGTAAVVAVGGLSAYPDRDTAKAFRKRRDPYRSSRSDGGHTYWGSGGAFVASCSGGSSSCGGSSSSGSSCGGGGGGGGCGGGGGS